MAYFNDLCVLHSCNYSHVENTESWDALIEDPRTRLITWGVMLQNEDTNGLIVWVDDDADWRPYDDFIEVIWGRQQTRETVSLWTKLKVSMRLIFREVKYKLHLHNEDLIDEDEIFNREFPKLSKREALKLCRGRA